MLVCHTEIVLYHGESLALDEERVSYLVVRVDDDECRLACFDFRHS